LTAWKGVACLPKPGIKARGYYKLDAMASASELIANAGRRHLLSY